MSRHRLITEWSTDDPTVAELLRELNAIPEHSVERHEAEAGLHMLQARWAWKRADQLRDALARDALRAAKREARAAARAAAREEP